jgi:intermembrane space import and assembly protein 40
MASGPCGEDFKAAFSCFVYSEEEPKGMDCVEKFKGMQDCFRAHPEIYGEGQLAPVLFPLSSPTDKELEIDDDDGEEYDFPRDEEGKVESPLPKSQAGPVKLPNGNPPDHSPVLGVTPETTMSKGVSRLLMAHDSR